ncbi:hypothetical protein [Snuella lapsa]|uniref:Redoxin domain-containing protein n=1 Tax=Snuella lapsa TaxID=870481 RepID=A0ABP6X3H3_9FLAO
MKHKRLFCARSAILLLALLGFIFFNEFKLTRHLSLKNTDEIENLRSRVLFQSNFSGFFNFSTDYYIQTINGDSKSIVDVFSDLTVVLYISTNQCTSCIDDSIEKIQERLKKHPNLEYIIFSSGFTLRELMLIKTNKKLKASIYSITNNRSHFFNKMDKALFPYYFTVNSNLEVSNIFFPQKSSSILEVRYFERLSSLK